MAKNTHPGFGNKECEKCHLRSGPPGAASLQKPVPALCQTCHDVPKRGTPAAKIHPPVAKGECVACHSPHASDQKSLLAESPKRLCVKCHAAVIADANKKHGHPPAASGDCATCHAPHESDQEALLVKPALALCRSCHDDLASRIDKGTPHRPVETGRCFICHASHGADEPGMLKKESANETCVRCHPASKGQLDAKHLGFSVAKANCASCHDPHVQAKGQKGLLLPIPHAPFARRECAKCHGAEKSGATIAKGNDLCFQCHPSSKDWLKKPVVHAPIKTERGCLSCHGAHGGAVKPILRRAEEKLCLDCHGKKLLAGKHVHPALEDGCTTCHDPHSSDKAKLLTKDVVALCTECHDDLSKHVHRTSGGKDPRTGEPLTCVGCHMPHSSDEEALLTHEPKRLLCLQCHDTSMPGQQGH